MNIIREMALGGSRLFTMRWGHLEEVGMSYTEHSASLSLGNQFLRNAAMAYAHAVWPSAFTDSSSKGLVHMQKMLRDKQDELLVRRHHERIDAQRQLLMALPKPRPNRPLIDVVSPQYAKSTMDAYTSPYEGRERAVRAPVPPLNASPFRISVPETPSDAASLLTLQ